MFLMFKFSWEVLFLERRDTEILNATGNKLFVSNEKHIGIHTIMLDMLYSYMSELCTPTIVEVSLKVFFGMAVVLCWSL